jgi:phospholipid N-methyltransferase/membrane-bound metal-dependent hydrolase YbcI (DUF457 family)
VNTYSHMLQTMAAARRLRPGNPGLARTAAIGAALPDLPYALRAARMLARRRGDLSLREVMTALDYYGTTEWAPDLLLHSLAPLIPAAALATLPGNPRTRAHLGALTAGLAGHALTDLLTHKTDARPPLWPLSGRRWHSPVSCWDRDAHAIPVTIAEHALTLLCAAWLAQQYWRPGTSGRRARRIRRQAGDMALFAARFARHPARVGAITPTSRHAVTAMLSGARLDRARLVVEMGTGTGAFTQVLLDSCGPRTKIVGFEIDQVMADRLRGRLTDKRLTIICDSAGNMRDYLGGQQADLIVSAVPLTSMPPAVRNQVLAEAGAVLAPGATMRAIQYSTARETDLARAFTTVRKRVVMRNLPPAFLYECSNPRDLSDRQVPAC